MIKIRNYMSYLSVFDFFPVMKKVVLNFIFDEIKKPDY